MENQVVFRAHGRRRTGALVRSGFPVCGRVNCIPGAWRPSRTRNRAGACRKPTGTALHSLLGAVRLRGCLWQRHTDVSAGPTEERALHLSGCAYSCRGTHDGDPTGTRLHHRERRQRASCSPFWAHCTPHPNPAAAQGRSLILCVMQGLLKKRLRL